MKGLEQFLVPWIISNLVGILILWAAIKKPSLARGMFSLLFGWACWFNFTTAHSNPEVYLDYAAMSVPLYSDFILGWFKDNITPMVTAIAIGQGLIALGMALNDWWVKLASIGAILFLLSIAPLGVGAGFPFSITVSIAAYYIYKIENPDYLWRSGRTAKKVSVQ